VTGHRPCGVAGGRRLSDAAGTSLTFLGVTGGGCRGTRTASPAACAFIRRTSLRLPAPCATGHEPLPARQSRPSGPDRARIG
jgi:hypothetical protein